MINDHWSINKFDQFKSVETQQQRTYITSNMAMVIFAIAPTQVTIECLFSTFAHNLNDHRTSLFQQLLEENLFKSGFVRRSEYWRHEIFANHRKRSTAHSGYVFIVFKWKSKFHKVSSNYNCTSQSIYQK